jgi:hypothetical protein
MPSNYVLLRKVTLASTATSVTFSSIPQTGYTDLKIVMSTRDARTGVDVSDILFNFNGAGVGSGITGRYLYGNGSSPTAAATTDSLAFGGSASNTANTFGNSEVYIPNYLSTDKFKSIISDSVSENNGAGAFQLALTGVWSNNAAIHTIAMTPFTSPFQIGSEFSLYGLASVNATPEISPFATGGDTVTTDGTYWYHTFLSSGLFAPAKTLSCDYLIVGGGGGGGTYGGGGGAGGVVTATSQSLTVANYSVVIGAGGARGTLSDNTIQTSGTSSSFNSSTGGGGGYGGSGEAGNKVNGAVGGASNGSGGGGGYAGSGAAGVGTGGSGGNGVNSSGYPSGGGGGAGGNGASASGINGGNGGTGITSSISGTSLSYAGGGGGGAGNPAGGSQGNPGTGGSSVGGNGGRFNTSDATAGVANTGSGGGGAGGASGGFGFGGAGGSGVVVIKYPVA